MTFLRTDTFSRIALTALIGIASYVGDVFLYRLKSDTLRAIADNLTHAVVGGLSWLLVIKLSSKSLGRNIPGVALCFLLSSVIDLDHFLLAKSWKLRDANKLGEQRPVLHCSLIPLSVWLISEIIYRLFHRSTAGFYWWIIVTAFLSHHVRDATRRGMWFGFLGSTPPIPYYLYLFIAMLLPYLIYWAMPSEMIKDDQISWLIQTV